MMQLFNLTSLNFRRLSLAVLFLLPCSVLQAGQGVGLSVTAGHDLIQGRAPLFDVNLLFFDSFGLRVSSSLQTTYFFQTEGSDTAHVERKISGQSVSYNLLKFWDMRHYQASQSMPLSFLGGYTTLGYSNSSLKLDQTVWTAEGGRLKKTVRQTHIRPVQGIIAVGFYGGDQFAVIDMRLQYRVSRYKAEWRPQPISFSAWSLILSAGVGF